MSPARRSEAPLDFEPFEETQRKDDAPCGYRPIGRQTSARIELLYCDIQRLLARDPSLTPAMVAEAAGLGSDWIVQDIRKPGWHVKNAAHLFRIEEALYRHPLWAPKTVFGETYREHQGSHVYRRLVAPEESPEFREDFLRWTVRRSDSAFIQDMRDDPWISITDASPNDPADYRFKRYAGAMQGRFSFSKQGNRLGDHPSKAYAAIVSKDFGEAAKHGQALCRDVVHINNPQNDRIVFRSIVFPCLEEKLILSKMKLEFWVPGRLRFNAPRADGGAAAAERN